MVCLLGILIILEEYLSSFKKYLAVTTSNAESLISELSSRIQNSDSIEAEALRVCRKALFPYGEPDGNEIMIQLGDCTEWATRLHEALSGLLVIQWVD